MTCEPAEDGLIEAFKEFKPGIEGSMPTAESVDEIPYSLEELWKLYNELLEKYETLEKEYKLLKSGQGTQTENSAQTGERKPELAFNFRVRRCEGQKCFFLRHLAALKLSPVRIHDGRFQHPADHRRIQALFC